MGNKVASGNTEKTKRKAPPHAWREGQSGNPSGRPKKTDEERLVDELCREKSVAALAVIESIMNNGQSDKARLSAAQYIMDRGNGKPVSKTELTGKDGGAVEFQAVPLYINGVSAGK